MFALALLLACTGPDVETPVDGDDDGFLAADDCNDADAFVFPGAAEACDGVDQDCDGAIDEGWDQDGDGVAPCWGDCDDADPGRHPGLEEACNGIDDDCDGVADNGFDQDGDLFSTCEGDCDDADPDRHPGLDELCNGGVDDDCDPDTSEAGDVDGDGLTLCAGDCDDLDPERIPGAAEVCDGLDQDCDGYTDEEPECLGCVQTGAYLICAESVSFVEAAGLCEAFGTSLATFLDREELIAVSIEAYAYTYNVSWIGLSDQASEGTWMWSDGSVLAYDAWWDGEPNGGTSESCAVTNFGDYGRWNDAPCTNYQVPFICDAP